MESSILIYEYISSLDELDIMQELPPAHYIAPENHSRHLSNLIINYLVQKLRKGQYVSHEISRAPILLPTKEKMSISHSGNYYAILLGGGDTAAIDIQICQTEKLSKVCTKFLTDKELLQLSILSITDKATYLHELWTAKEAIYKVERKNEGSLKEISSINTNNTDKFCWNRYKSEYQIYTNQIKNLYIAIAQKMI